jgi:hypothetical protein
MCSISRADKLCRTGGAGMKRSGMIYPLHNTQAGRWRAAEPPAGGKAQTVLLGEVLPLFHFFNSNCNQYVFVLLLWYGHDED